MCPLEVSGMWVCEVHAKGALSIKTLADVLERNVRHATQRLGPTGWEIIGQFPSFSEAQEFNRAIKQVRRGQATLISSGQEVKQQGEFGDVPLQ